MVRFCVCLLYSVKGFFDRLDRGVDVVEELRVSIFLVLVIGRMGC